MIIIASNVLRVDEVVPEEAANHTDKMEMWTKEALVIPKNYVGHVAVVTTLPSQDLCIERDIQTTQQMVPRCLVSTDGEGRAVIPIYPKKTS